MNPSTALARVLIDELIACGVTEVVLAPGFRNAPLSMALHDADAAGRLRLHVRIDERTAGFLALGLARGSGRPVAVVTTSGTAVANLHPAVLEAHHGGVPLIVLSADRPPWLRDVGANQAVDQRSVFGPALRMFHEFGVPRRGSAGRTPAGGRWSAGRSAPPGGPAGSRAGAAERAAGRPAAAGRRPRPMSRLDRAGPNRWPAGGAVDHGSPAPTTPSARRFRPDRPGERVLFVADLTHPWAAAIADAGHLVIAEAGGAAGSAVLERRPAPAGSAGIHRAARPDRVIVLGRPTLFRQVQRLLGDPRVVVDVIAHPASYADPSGTARAVAAGWPDLRELPRPGMGGPVAGGERSGPGRRSMPVWPSWTSTPRPGWPATWSRRCRSGPPCVLGSSQAPRDVALTAAARDGLRVVANRGVAGIDGTISTAVGVALDRRIRSDGPTVALSGDLTFLHDITGLVIGPHEPRPDLTIVVSNNDGGAIFATLEPGEPRHARAFERVFGTPHGVLLAGLAEASGAEHVLVSTADELPDAIAEPGGIRVVEVPTSRTELAPLLRKLTSEVELAVRG